MIYFLVKPARIALVTAVTLFLMVSCGKSYETKVDNEKGYQIDYPAGWDTTKLDPRMNFVAMEDFTDTTDLFKEQFNISIYPHGGVSLEIIVDQNIEMARRVYGDLKIDKLSAKNKNGVDYIQLKMPYSADNLNLINQATFLVDETNLFTITEICEAGKAAVYQATFDEIINSFNWTE